MERYQREVGEKSGSLQETGTRYAFLSIREAVKEVQEELREESDLETMIQEVMPELPPDIAYGLPLEPVPLDYEQLWYGEKPGGSPSDDTYWTEELPSDVRPETLDTQEVKETMGRMQYGTIVGTPLNVNNIERRQANLTFKLHPEQFHLFETLHAFTREVNYAPVGYA